MEVRSISYHPHFDVISHAVHRRQSRGDRRRLLPLRTSVVQTPEMPLLIFLERHLVEPLWRPLARALGVVFSDRRQDPLDVIPDTFALQEVVMAVPLPEPVEPPPALRPGCVDNMHVLHLDQQGLAVILRAIDPTAAASFGVLGDE